MRRMQLWLTASLLLVAFTQRAGAQAFVPVATDGQSGFVSLSPVAGDAPAFLNADGTLPRGLNMSGTVGGQGATNVGDISIGFDYLRPFWTSRDFILAVPPGFAGNFPLLGDTGHVDNHFALAPIVKYKYDVQDIGLAFKASGTFLSLGGDLNRTVTDTIGNTGTLVANSSLTIVAANLPEISGRVLFEDLFAGHPHLHGGCLDGLLLDVGVGTRYSSLQQSYTGDLTNTLVNTGVANSTTRASTQKFSGLGFTTSADFTLPVKEHWVFFTNLRGSIIVGENAESSTLDIILGKAPATHSAINQTRTQLVPIGEIEIGTEAGYELGQALRDGTLPPLVTVRLAFTGQFWGGVGPLSAGSPQGFTNSNLFLAGAHIMVTLHH